MLNKILQTFGIRTFSAIINLAVAVLLSQLLGPEGKGNQSIILTTISIILIFSNLVGGATLVYLVPRITLSRLLLPSYVWSVLMGIVGYGILLLSGLVEKEFILHICALSVVNSIFSIHTNVLIGQKRISESNWLTLLQSALLIIALLVIYFITKEFSIYAYLNALYISLGLCMLVSAFMVRAAFIGFRLPPMHEYRYAVMQMFRYGLQNQVAHVTQLLSFRMSFYILEEFRGMASVGVFSNGISIAESIWMVAKSMAVVQYSFVSNSDDNKASAQLTIKLVKAALAVSIFLIIPLLILPKETYVIIFGDGFEEVKPVIWSLLPGVLIYNLSILLGHYFSGTGRYYMNTRISAAGFIVSLVLYLFIIPRMDIYGAGIATSLSYVFTSMLFLWFFARENRGWARQLLYSKGELEELIGLVRRK